MWLIALRQWCGNGAPRCIAAIQAIEIGGVDYIKYVHQSTTAADCRSGLPIRCHILAKLEEWVAHHYIISIDSSSTQVAVHRNNL